MKFSLWLLLLPFAIFKVASSQTDDEDPLAQVAGECADHNFDCGACVDAGCFWCPGDALCFQSIQEQDFFDTLNKTSSCPLSEDWRTNCEAVHDDNAYTDPLYDSWKAIFQLVGVEEVWKMGYTGKGVHVRVNDDGVDANHAEFEGRFDVENSCDVYLPDTENDPEASHGTACASIIGAAGDNDVCAVGIAPDVTISACFQSNEATDEQDAAMLRTKMTNVHISSNSWGPNFCTIIEDESDDSLGDDATSVGVGTMDDDETFDDAGGFVDDDTFDDDGSFDDDGAFDDDSSRQLRLLHARRLQACPFKEDHVESPCGICGADFGSQDCERAIVDYCSVYYEVDKLACADYLDLYVDCNYHILAPEIDDIFALAVTEGRKGLGTIYVWASGNELATGQDVNSDGFVNSRYTISVGATDQKGDSASYSTPGAALLLSAPGGDSNDFLSHHSVAKPTGLGGGCMDAGDGTSFACPLVAGVIALVLEANPNLGWRDMQGILVATSKQMNAEGGGWTLNGAGYSHSYEYGFGLVNAPAAVNASLTWENFGPEKQIMVESGSVNLAIENNDTTKITSNLTVEAKPEFVVESVVVYLDVLHATRGDLLVELVSPSGTISVMHPGKRPENTQLSGDERWKLMTVRNYFENPSGVWSLHIVDVDPQKATCVNLPFEYTGLSEDGEEFTSNCDSIEEFQDCAGGQVTFDLVIEEVDEDTGRTGADACCACGGGEEPSATDLLRSWRMVVYGHDTVGGNTTSVSRNNN